jgi:hypothetical protein
MAFSLAKEGGQAMLRTTLRRDPAPAPTPMNKLRLLSVGGAIAALVAPATLVVACATDNGDAVHGPQFGPVPERPDGSGADARPAEESGATANDAEAGAEAGDPDGAAACTTGTVAVLAGNDSSLTGAVQLHGGAWTGVAITGGAAKSTPSLVAFGTGFTGLTRGASDALQAVTYDAAWSGATAVASLVTLGTPAIAVVGAKAQAAFLSGPESGSADSHKLFRIENAGTTWSAADPVTVGASASFGPSAPSAAGAGADLVIAQDGDDSMLYTQRWSTTWAMAAPIGGGVSTLKAAPPALVAVTGKFDIVLLYADAAPPHVIGFATRDAMAPTGWSNGQVTQATAQTAEQMSVASLSPTTLLVAFRGNDSRPYTMLGTIGATSITWSVPAPLLADTSIVDTAPAVARGVCGDDAIAVFAAGGVVKATQYRGTTWTVPGTVAGATGSRVSVATR